MLEQLKYLVQLQALEDKKKQLLRDCEATPKKIAEIEKEFEDYEMEYLAKKGEYDHAKKMHRSLEQFMAELEAKIARSKNRMSEVKTNKEYQAMLKEIEDVKQDIAVKEDEALEYMEKIDSIGKDVKIQENELKERVRKLDVNRQMLQQESDRVSERLDKLKAIEKKVRDKLEPIILKKCDHLLLKQSGIAVAPVEGSVCQICHLNIPPQKFNELQRNEAILQCPHCHRFLYWLGHAEYRVFEDDLDGI
ncbi:MAG: zinc ribbon domain-containing protein [Syntrophobacteraceae bacterium]